MYINSLKVEEFNYNPSKDILQVWYNLNGDPNTSYLTASDFRWFLYKDGSLAAYNASFSAEALDYYLTHTPTRSYAFTMIENFMMKCVEDQAMEEQNYIPYEDIAEAA